MPFSQPLHRPVLRRPFLRRSALTAAPLLLAAGCKWTEDGSESVPDPTEPALDSDDTLTEKALEAISVTTTLVERVAKRHIGLSTPLGELSSLHREHASVLEGEVTGGSGPEVPRSSAKAISLVVRREQELQATLTSLAGKAASGPLAGSLASMAAGVAQQLIVLRQTPVPEGSAA